MPKVAANRNQDLRANLHRLAVAGEVTRLAHQALAEDLPANRELVGSLRRASTNTGKAGRLARHLSTTHVDYQHPSDAAAAARMRALVQDPHGKLTDIERHLCRATRRLYRVRNLVLHGGVTDPLTASAALRAAVPLLGAGIDRVARGAILQGTEPLGLAARARMVIDNADHGDPGDLADLLQLADT